MEAGPGNVAIVEPVGAHGGMNYYDFGLARGLVAAGCNVSLYTCEETVTAPQEGFVLRRTFRGMWGDAPRWLRGFRYLRDLLQSFSDGRRRGCALVHLHFFHSGALEFFALALARIFFQRTVVTMHDVESFCGDGTPAAAQRFFGLAHRLIVHNNYSRDEVVKRLGIAAAQIDVVPHGHYVASMGQMPTREAARVILGIAEDGLLLLFFGQIKRVKGLTILLDAMALARSDSVPVRLLVAGKVWKDDFGVYEEQMERLGIADMIQTDVRYIPDNEAPLYFAAADLVVLPYRRIYQSGVLLMAMSCRRAVLASDIPGMVEIVQDGDNGFLFRDGDARALAKRIMELATSPAKIAIAQERGYETVCRDNGWDLVGQLTYECYKRAWRSGESRGQLK